MDLEFLDILIVAIYFATVLFIGFVIARKKEKHETSAEDFILAGRKLTLPLFVGTLVATWYGSILGVGEFVYNSGLSAWVSFGLPYYLAAGLFAAFIAKKIRNSNVNTIPEQIEKKYGTLAGRISSLIILIITIPAAYFLMLGVLVQMFTDWNLILSVTFGAVISLAYLFTGGFRADVYTNVSQFLVMYVGFGALVYFSYKFYGGYEYIQSNIPASHLTAQGTLPWQYIASWYIIAFQTFVDPGFHQRCSAAKSPKVAQRGIAVSIGFWAVFDFLTLVAGLYARANFELENPLMAYPELGNAVLPVIWKGVFLTAMIAAVMSTLDSYAFLSASTIGNDLIKPIMIKRNGKSYSSRVLTGIGLLITGIFGVLLSSIIPSVVDLIFKTASIVVPSLIIPLTLSMSEKYQLSSKSAVSIMLYTSFITFVWTILKDNSYSFFVNVEPMFIGIIFAAVIGLFTIKKAVPNS